MSTAEVLTGPLAETYHRGKSFVLEPAFRAHGRARGELCRFRVHFMIELWSSASRPRKRLPEASSFRTLPRRSRNKVKSLPSGREGVTKPASSSRSTSRAGDRHLPAACPGRRERCLLLRMGPRDSSRVTIQAASHEVSRYLVKGLTHASYCKMSLRFSSNSALSISPLAIRSFKISVAREAVSYTRGSSSRRTLR